MSKPISERWREAAEKWVELEAAADLLESTKSSVMSQMMSDYGDIATSRAEALVRRDPKWIDHVEKVCAARKRANLAKVDMEFFKLKFNEWQSHEANNRVEARL